MKCRAYILWFSITRLPGTFLPTTTLAKARSHAPLRVLAPPAGKLRHGVYSGGKTGAEDDITPADLCVQSNLAPARVFRQYLASGKVARSGQDLWILPQAVPT